MAVSESRLMRQRITSWEVINEKTDNFFLFVMGRNAEAPILSLSVSTIFNTGRTESSILVQVDNSETGT